MSSTSLLGGAERILLDRAQALEGPVVLACPDGELGDSAREAGLTVITLRSRRAELRAGVRDRVGAPLRIGAQSAEVRRLVRRLAPRCVIGWSMRGVLASAGALAGARAAPPLVFAHNDLAPSPGVARVVRLAAGRAAGVLALSRAIAEDLDPLGRLAVEVIHPGVDLDRFAPSPLPAGPPEVLVLGAVVDWKRPDLALETAALAARDLPGLRLRLAGAPMGESGRRLAAWLRARASEPDLAGLVSQEGAVEDVPGALRRATCVLHCADREPFGVALVEALACARPVVAPAAAGPLEIVNERCGALYRPGDAPAAAAALLETVRRAPDLARPAREQAERLFDRRVSNRRFRAAVEGVLR